MAIEAVGADSAQKIKKTIGDGVKYLQEIETFKLNIKDIKDALKDLIASAAEETEIDKKMLNDAVKMAFEHSFDEKLEYIEDVGQLLELSGQK